MNDDQINFLAKASTDSYFSNKSKEEIRELMSNPVKYTTYYTKIFMIAKETIVKSLEPRTFENELSKKTSK